MIHGIEAATEPNLKESDHERSCSGVESSGDHSLSLENPAAATFEIQESMARDDKKGIVALNRASRSSVPVEKLKRGGRFKAYCEWAVICTVIVVIWGLLTLPTIYYYVPQDSVSSPSVPANETDTFQCIPEVYTANETDTFQCIPEVYTGSVCRNALAVWQKCVPNRCGDNEVFIQTSPSQKDLESNITFLLKGLQLINPSAECREVVEPFLCLYIFGLCDGSGELYLPSSGECQTLTTETCAREFQIAVGIVGRENLPQCRTLPPSELECNEVCTEDEPGERNGSEDGSGSSDVKEPSSSSTTMQELLVPYEDLTNEGLNITESTITRPITCREGFYLDDELGLCRAECSKWENLPHHVELTTHVVAILGAVVYIISASVLLLFSCLHHKRMFRFPSVFIVYEMFPLGLFEVFLLIAFTDREGLFCSQRDVIGSIENTTLFCNIQGVVFHYVALQETLLWLFHIVAVFWLVKFPLHAKIFENKRYFRYVHLIMLGVALVLPCMALPAVLGTGGCRLASFPPFQCFARNSDVVYYAFILPASILMAAGITLIILILHVLIRVTTPQRSNSLKEQDTRTTLKGKLCRQLYAHIKKTMKLHSPELKVLIISCYYVIFAVFIVTTFTITHAQMEAQLLRDIGSYFACEATGTSSECERSFAELGGEIFSILSLILIGLFPIVNLAYVLNIQELKHYISRHAPKWLLSSTSGTATASSADIQRS